MTHKTTPFKYYVEVRDPHDTTQVVRKVGYYYGYNSTQVESYLMRRNDVLNILSVRPLYGVGAAH